MKVAVVGNLAGVGRDVVLALRRAGVHADLFLTHDDLAAVGSDTFSEAFDPEWAHLFDPDLAWLGGLAPRARRAVALVSQRAGLIRRLSQYDVIHAHSGSLAFSSAGAWWFIERKARPYVAVATGSDYREAARFDHGRPGRRLRAFFRNADDVLLLNADMVLYRAELGVPGARFFPFIVDEIKYAPQARERRATHEGKLLCYMMSRLDFGFADAGAHRSSMKDNHRFLLALDRFRREDPNVHALVLDRGTDRELAHWLVGELRLEDFVTFIPPANEDERRRLMADADVVVDQFHVGAFGLGAVEALAMGKPLITFFRPECAEETYGGMPPILNARTTDEIVSALRAARNEGVREQLSRDARAWTLTHHARDAVVAQLLPIYERVLRGTNSRAVVECTA